LRTLFRATIESNLRIDVRPILSTLTAPTLVIHAREDPVPVQFGRCARRRTAPD
jgi:pimeloyl-ACP methyl ester carboxylesterase